MSEPDIRLRDVYGVFTPVRCPEADKWPDK